MSDNEDLLGDDLGDHSLADYNLGNEEEEQLLADDYENGTSQNVPSSVEQSYGEGSVSREYAHENYNNQQPPYQPIIENECVVPNIAVEVPSPAVPDTSTYAPYNEAPIPYESEHAVPPPIPAAPLESPQIVPSEVVAAPLEEVNGSRERFVSERPHGVQRTPQIRDIPDSLDKVMVGRSRTTWRHPQLAQRHPYRRAHPHWNNNFQRQSYPPQNRQTQFRPVMRPGMRPDMRLDMQTDMRTRNRPNMRSDLGPDMRSDLHPDMRSDMRADMRLDMRPDMRPDIRLDMRPDIRLDMRSDIHPDMRPDTRLDMRSDMRPDMRPDIRPDMRSDMRPDMRPDMRLEMRSDIHPDMRPNIRPEMPEPMPGHSMRLEMSPERPMLPPQDMNMPFRPMENRLPYQNFPPRFPPPFRPNMEEPRPNFGPNIRPNFEPRQMYPYQRPPFNPRAFGPPLREVAPNGVNHMPQVTIHQALPGMPLPNNIPKIEEFGPKMGPREPEVRMLPVQLPNLPPGGLPGKKVLINPHFKGNFQPPVEGLPTYIPTRIRKPPLSPTLESNFGPIKDIDDAAERFIAEQRNALAKAAGRKMPRRSPQRFIEDTTIEIENELAVGVGGRRSDDELLRRQEEFINANRAGLRRRMRSPTPPRSPERRPRPQPLDEESEYRRRVREQEALRERVLRAKELRRRRHALADRAERTEKTERERERNEKEKEKVETVVEPTPSEKEADDKPTSTEDNKPDTTKQSPEREVEIERSRSPVKKEIEEVNSTCESLTPPRAASPERALTPPLPRPAPPRDDDDLDLDLILDDIDDILSDDDDTGRFKELNKQQQPKLKPKPQVDLRSKLPPKSLEKKPRQKIVFNEDKPEKKKREKSPPRKAVVTSSTKNDEVVHTDRKTKKADAGAPSQRPRIIFDNKLPAKDTKEVKPKFSNRRVVLRKTILGKEKHENKDPTKPNPGIFNHAMRTAIGTEIVVKKEPAVEYESGSDEDPGTVAVVTNLPHGITDTRLKTLAGNSVQSLMLDKEEHTARIVFRTTPAAEGFKRKFHNKMVAATKLTVTLQ